MSDRGEFPIGYCALEYRARDDESSSDPKDVILIVAKQTSGELSIRVHPDWRKIARLADHSTLQAVFDDLPERALLDPESLIKQLSYLSVGPLNAYEAGQALADHPDLLQMFSRFREI